MIQATASAKAILLGEHAVVYHQPAIAIPVLQLQVKASVVPAPTGAGLQIVADDIGIALPVTLNPQPNESPLNAIARLVLNKLNHPLPDLTITLQSDIPIASGLGSGAAISTAIARALSSALGHPLAAPDLNELVYEVEKLHHGTPSGVDNTVIVYERPVYFVRGRPIHFLTVGCPFRFVIGDTGIRALTRVAVGDVNRLYQADPERYRIIFDSIGSLVDSARQAIEQGQAEVLGSLMNQNHHYLQQLTVSSTELDRLVQAALSAGALGAKLSGGGRGGNMIALVTEDTSSAVQVVLRDAGAVRVFETVLF